MTLYKIKDWEEIYENNKTRLIKSLRFVLIPNAHDGAGYIMTASQKNGAALLGSWMVILQVASRCPERGTLKRSSGAPHDAKSIASVTRLPEKTILEALRWFAAPEVQWLEIINQDKQTNLFAQEPDNQSDGTTRAPQGQDGAGKRAAMYIEKEGKKEVGRAVGTAPASDSEWLADLQKNPAYTALNVPQEFAKMQAWCSANRKQPSRRRFINWLNRAEKPMQPTAAYRPMAKDGPPGWRDTLRDLFPDNTYDASWSGLPDSTRKLIEQAYDKQPTTT